MKTIDSHRPLIPAFYLRKNMYQGTATDEDTTNGKYETVLIKADGTLTLTFSNDTTLAITGLTAGQVFALDSDIKSVTSTAAIMMS